MYSRNATLAVVPESIGLVVARFVPCTMEKNQRISVKTVPSPLVKYILWPYRQITFLLQHFFFNYQHPHCLEHVPFQSPDDDPPPIVFINLSAAPT